LPVESMPPDRLCFVADSFEPSLGVLGGCDLTLAGRIAVSSESVSCFQLVRVRPRPGSFVSLRPCQRGFSYVSLRYPRRHETSTRRGNENREPFYLPRSCSSLSEPCRSSGSRRRKARRPTSPHEWSGFGASPRCGEWSTTSTRRSPIRKNRRPGRRSSSTRSPLSRRPSSAPNLPGFAHVAFAVDDVEAIARAVFEHGGSAVGELTVRELPGVGSITFQYAADPEGNIIEIQHWT
jgi:catechol 2,3-dioxygenase-like lactoylglutathione lyase family enzyme